MRQGAPSTAGQIAPEAWQAMSEAAQRAGMPLEQWLRSQLFGTTAAGLLPPGAATDAAADVATLQRRIAELVGQMDTLGAMPAAPPAPAPVAVAPLPVEPPPPAAPYADPRLEATIRELNEKLEAMHLAPLRVEAPPPAAPAPRAADPVEMAVAEIAARQNELYAELSGPRRAPAADPLVREPSPAPAAAREIPLRDPIRDRFIRDPFASGPFPTRANSAPAAPVSAPLEMSAPLAPPLPPSPRTATINESLAALQLELVNMRQTLTALAPRRAVDELQRVVQQIGERVERSGTRDEELRGTLLALRDMIGSLKLPEHPTLMLGRIDTLERKLDIVNAKAVDGAMLARLQAQASEIRELLARSLSADSVRLLAEQVSLLATKVTEMVASDDRAIRTAVGSLERRLDTLADRIASQPAPVLPLGDLIGRLDSIQASLASARQELPAGLEAMIRGLTERIERMDRPAPVPDDGPRFDSLNRQIGELTQKIEKVMAGAEIAGQLASIERAVNDLFIQMEETRATLLATSGPRSRPPSGGGTVTGAIHAKRERAAEVESSPAPAPVAAAAVAQPAPAPAPVVPEASFTPAPASIPKPFEPHLMRAALEELNRSFEAPAPQAQPAPVAEPAVTPPPAEMPAAPAPTPVHAAAPRADVPVASGAFDDEFDFRPVDLDEQAAARGPVAVNREPPRQAATGAPNRAAFIAQARRATLPPGAGTPELRSHIADRHRRQPTRWLARIRAMLLIGLCGSALAYGSWHFLAQMRAEQLRAAAPAPTIGPATATLPKAVRPTPPAGQPAPEDITGSVGKPVPRTQPPAPPPAAAPEAPAATPAPAPIGPSSMSLPTELPGGIASQALRAAAFAGDPAAAFEIARRFVDGEGVTSSPVRAAEWFAYAAKNGSIPAAYRLGTIYEKGMDGVPRDAARARQLYEQAANAGNVAAMHNLGVMLASGGDGQPDYRTAAIWFTQAAERGVRDSQYNLAVLYARGFGVPTNLGEAWRWFALAAARGDGEAAVKRDEIAAKLDAKALAAARTAVDNWSPLMVDAKANDTATASWDASRKTASR